MYADDLIILSLSHEGLQKCLDELNRYCKEWGLKVNNEKTKCIKFLIVSKLYNKSFNIGNTPLQNVKEFTYLEITINGAGSFQPAMRDLSDQANRAIFSLNSRYKLNKLPLNIAFKLFDTMITPILLYGSKVWRAYEYNTTKKSDEWGKLTIETVQTQFIKHLIGVNKSTTNIMVHGETGRYPLIKLKTVKFFKRIVSQNKHKLCQMVYKYENSVVNSNTQMKQRPNICYFLSDIEKQISYDELLNKMDILKSTDKRIKDRLRTYYEKLWKDIYSKHKSEFKMESYVTQVTNTSHRRALTKLPLSDHKLEIQCRRHIRPKINRENRTCNLCSKLNKQAPIEDEVHFITRCDNFMQIKNLRNEFFNDIILPKRYTDEKQYIMLMKMGSKEDNIKLAKFVCQLSKERENIINRQKAFLDSLSIMSD